MKKKVKGKKTKKAQLSLKKKTVKKVSSSKKATDKKKVQKAKKATKKVAKKKTVKKAIKKKAVLKKAETNPKKKISAKKVEKKKQTNKKLSLKKKVTVAAKAIKKQVKKTTKKVAKSISKASEKTTKNAVKKLESPKIKEKTINAKPSRPEKEKIVKDHKTKSIKKINKPVRGQEEIFDLSTNESKYENKIIEKDESLQAKYENVQVSHQENIYAYDPYATPIDVPGVYLKDRVITLVIDPKFIYTYWELKPETIEAGRHHIGHDSEIVLRIYDVTCIESFNGYNAHNFWDISVNASYGGWYVRLGSANKSLIVDVGLRNSRGEFHVLVRSNVAFVPRNTIAPTEKIYWMTVNSEGQAVITEVEDFTEEDLELLRKMLGEDFYRRYMKGTLGAFLGASQVRELFKEIPPSGSFSKVSTTPHHLTELSDPKER